MPAKVTVNMGSQSKTWFSTEFFPRSKPILCVMPKAARVVDAVRTGGVS